MAILRFCVHCLSCDVKIPLMSCIIVISILIGITIIGEKYKSETKKLQSEAVNMGFAKFTPDENNNPIFHWIDPQKGN